MVMDKKQIAIIGAGVSGLTAWKHRLSKGFNPIVFESESQVGGVWTKTIRTTRLQLPKEMYQFSDFPWPPSVMDTFPTQQQTEKEKEIERTDERRLLIERTELKKEDRQRQRENRTSYARQKKPLVFKHFRCELFEKEKKVILVLSLAGDQNESKKLAGSKFMSCMTP
ncbi:hypothetical protein E3N88_31416 [Mikania micrantha]|uniref:Flavin-containing monooxygenase n=1 Tax=Mikania micrantha TaxID=192012 RepID=A0A5N6MQ72_9ASTR|nr:hypothetical protein E3N88_31416 [Mikania micrantha]